MATVTVLRVFYDQRARRKRTPGDVFAATDERARELASRLPEHVAVTYKEPQPQAEVEALEYESLSKTELQALCDERGIAYAKSATKAKLVALLEG